MQAMLEGEQKTKLSKIGELVAAYKVGSSTVDSKLCQWLFPCRGDYHEIEESEIKGRGNSDFSSSRNCKKNSGCAFFVSFLANIKFSSSLT